MKTQLYEPTSMSKISISVDLATGEDSSSYCVAEGRPDGSIKIHYVGHDPKAAYEEYRFHKALEVESELLKLEVFEK